MSDEDALLAAIAVHPDEDTPRLAYADWLDEHGRPIRAEFIRVQIEVARVETLPRIVVNRYVDLFRRQQELTDHHRAELLGPLAALPPEAGVEFHRGFVSGVTVNVVEFREFRHRLAATRPLPRVIISAPVGPVRQFLGFDVSHLYPDWHTSIVSAIRTESEPGMDDDAPWGTSEVELHPFSWPRLEELDLSGAHLGDVNTAALLRPESFPVLVDLDVSANDLTDTGVEALLGSGVPAQLRRLILGGNPISDAGAIALAERWPAGDADRLEDLNLRFTNIGVMGHRALTARFGGRLTLF